MQARMRHASQLLTLCALLLLHCNPQLAPPDGAGASLDDDAAAAAPLTGDDGGGVSSGDDASGAVDPWADAAAWPGDDAAGPMAADVGPDAVADAAPSGACPAPLAAGDLVVDELMIESVAGAGDYGEWLEIRSTLPCVADLRGLHGETADGAKIRSFDVTGDLWLAPGGTIVVADSADPTLNHDLPGLVMAWTGNPGDVLRNAGGTVTLRAGDAVVDSVTWPSYKGAVGTSLELPTDCPASSHGDFGLWQPASASWFPGFHGTPNAPNSDVRCP
jgi:hypothetical protein